VSERKNSKLNEKLDLILENQKKILENESKILGEEMKIESLEKREIEHEKNVENDSKQALKELDLLEKEFKKNSSSPIKNITQRDMFKGFIGAFVGIMGHFAFSKAADLAVGLSIARSTVLFVVAFLIVIVMLYYSGFRNIEKHIVLKFMPLRALVLYGVSIVTIILVYLLFGKIHFPVSFIELYNLVGASIILAVMGACTADLIGRSE